MKRVYSRNVAMRNPLKQGLKHVAAQPAKKRIPHVAMRNPLKQGLKPKFHDLLCTDLIVAMRNPLKQGLKQ